MRDKYCIKYRWILHFEKMDFRNKKAAMFVAHPGHVLRAFHWMEIAKPLVFVVTDGSAPDQPARLPSTTVLLVKVGARQGSIYG